MFFFSPAVENYMILGLGGYLKKKNIVGVFFVSEDYVTDIYC